MSTLPGVGIPRKATSEGTDLKAPTRELLEDLRLLATLDDETTAASKNRVLHGPPDSIAVIKAGLTAGTKWWAAGAGATVIAAWGSVLLWWGDQGVSVKVAVIAAAALVTAALVLSIAYMIASDVRGRAAATVASIQARASVATALLSAAQELYEPEPPPASPRQLVPLASPLGATRLDGDDDPGWRAVAIERDSDGTLEYVLVKDSGEVKLPHSKIRFDPVAGAVAAPPP